MGSQLDALFAPRSVAVIGASEDPGKAGHAMMCSLAGFPGPLYPVNPKAAEVLGRDAYASPGDLPEAVDLAVLVVPPSEVPRVLDNCGTRGIRAAVVCAGGFAESGEDGAELQRRAAATARRHGIRLLGPNTSGFVNPRARVAANFMPTVDQLRPGPAAIVAQSGGMNLLLSFLADAEGLGLNLGAGLGNAADVGFAEVLDHVADDEATTVVGLHVEGVSDGRALYSALRRLTARKPVVALKVGRADVGEFARSHTGALIGSYEVARAALEQAGAVLVEDSTELVDAMRALADGRLPAKRTPGVAVVTGQAGPGLIIADQLGASGVPLPELGEPATAELTTLLPPLTHQRNPVDTGRPAATFPRVIETVATDPSIDVVVVHSLDEPGAFDPVRTFASTGTDGVRTLFASQGPRGALEVTADWLGSLAVPMYPTPERAARAARALVADSAAAYRVGREDAATGRGPDTAWWSGPASDAAPVPPVTEDAAKALLAEAGIPVPRAVACPDRAAAHAALHELSKPVVVKVLHPEVAHKTDIGGVVAGVRTLADLEDALDSIDAIDVPGDRRYLVEEQAGDGIELIVGAVTDPAFGPVVMLGLGGTGVALGAASGLRLAPLSETDAAGLVRTLPSALLHDFRGQPPLDAAVLADVLCRVGEIAATHPGIEEIEINPLRVTNGRALALDALVTVATGDGDRRASIAANGGR
jgi:acyl-CoA synthetase (NDP forming)